MNGWRLRIVSLSLLVLGSACGGHVGLGSRERPGGPAAEAPRVLADDPLLAPSDLLVDLGEVRASGPLAVAGDFIYLSGFQDGATSGLYRCRKTDCRSTFERLPAVSDNLSSLHVDGARLGVVAYDPEHWIGSVALPDGNDPRVAISGLPRHENLEPLFRSGFVYWPLLTDEALYRCALPDCAGGPRKLMNARILSSLTTDSDTVVVVADGLLVRLPRLGEGPVQWAFPDETMSPTVAVTEDTPYDGARGYAELVAAGAGAIYASLGDSPSNTPTAAQKLVRWRGGAREDMRGAEGHVSRLELVGEELYWLADRVAELETYTLASCWVESCQATLRHLGTVNRSRAVAADAEQLYWIEDTTVRSARRLPAP